MKKLVLLFLFVLVVTGCSKSGDTTVEVDSSKSTNSEVSTEVVKSDLRSVQWGMTPESVKDAEFPTLPIDEREGSLVFEDKINDLDTYLMYNFTENNELFRGGYIVTSRHSNPTLYVTDFKRLKDNLTEKYGSPKEENTIWLNDLYKDDPNNYGLAVVTGKVVFMAKWETETTNIALSLRGDNYEPSFGFSYTGKEYAKYAEDFDKKVMGNDGL
jgi:hypothetical protein